MPFVLRGPFQPCHLNSFPHNLFTQYCFPQWLTSALEGLFSFSSLANVSYSLKSTTQISWLGSKTLYPLSLLTGPSKSTLNLFPELFPHVSITDRQTDTLCYSGLYLRYFSACVVCTCVYGHTHPFLTQIVGVFLTHASPCFLRQGLSGNLELIVFC